MSQSSEMDAQQGGANRHARAAAISAGGGTLISTLKGLWPHMWPAARADLKRRVLLAFVLLVGAKLATIVMPFAFKYATDALVAVSEGNPLPKEAIFYFISAPLALVAIYGALRVSVALLTQLRDGLFAKVALHAVRRLAYTTFEHMHALSLRFHLERKTGGLTRVLERGRNGIEELVRLVILQMAPTVVELVARVLRAAVLFRLALRSRRGRYRDRLHGVDLSRHRMAHSHPAPHERIRHRRKREGSRTHCSTTRQ